MDVINDLPEVFGSVAERQDIRPVTSADLTLLRKLQITSLEQMSSLTTLYAQFYAAYPDTTMPPLQFAKHLFTDRNAWFVEVGDVGVVYLTNIIPELSADFSVAFWDWKFGKDRVELVRSVAKTAMTRFALKRLTALLPATNSVLIEKMERVGFEREGLLRLGWNGELHAVVLGALLEDVWNAPEMLPTSLD